METAPSSILHLTTGGLPCSLLTVLIVTITCAQTPLMLSRARVGEVIVWHDYGRWGVNGVSRWLHELARTGKDICRLPGSSLAILRV